jgi:hypothetical protein
VQGWTVASCNVLQHWGPPKVNIQPGLSPIGTPVACLGSCLSVLRWLVPHLLTCTNQVAPEPAAKIGRFCIIRTYNLQTCLLYHVR